MPKLYLFCFFLFFCLWSLADESEAEKKDLELPIHRNNWYLFSQEYSEDRDYGLSRVLPFYSYEKQSSRVYEDFFFWPFLAGYKITKNPDPDRLPFATYTRWYNFPMLTLNAKTIANATENNTFVSLMLLTYFQERTVANKYESKTWYTLPLLSFYNREILRENEAKIDFLTTGNILFEFEDIVISHKEKRFSSYRWSWNPTSLILGADSFAIISQQKWGEDSIFSMFSFGAFALFTVSTTFYDFPGKKYERFSRHEADLTIGMKKLFQKSKQLPTTRLGVLSPFILFENSPVGLFSWQFLPLFAYSSTNEKQYKFSIVPFGLNIKDTGVGFEAPLKIFPLIYYDKAYESVDFLWPIFRYTHHEDLKRKRFTARFLFDYNSIIDSKGQRSTSVSMVEQLLFSYVSTQKQTQMNILAFGLGFSYINSKSEYQWRLLGFGYSKSNEENYLQLFYLPIPLGK